MNPQGAMAAAMAIGLLGLNAAESGEKTDRVFEMRTYWSPEGRLGDLNARFRDHTVKLFEKHGITNVGYWTPIDNKENKLVYILSYPSRDAAKKSWAAFGADPEWKAAAKASEAKGKLLSKAPESVYLKATDYSPEPKASAAGDRVFELRTYTASPKNLDNLNARFRNHTLKLFEKHGMTNIGYWVPLDEKKGASDTLIYILAHKSEEAAKQSFGAFRDDPAWKTAREDSEKNAGGSLTVKDGVKSEFMKATDYSPIR